MHRDAMAHMNHQSNISRHRYCFQIIGIVIFTEQLMRYMVEHGLKGLRLSASSTGGTPVRPVGIVRFI